jgi:beta-phosphoglucomutase-like phosphatase (HAD superfamily)
LERLCLDAKHTIVFENTVAGLVSATTAGISTVVVGQDAENPNFSKALCVDPLLTNFRISLDRNNEERS